MVRILLILAIIWLVIYLLKWLLRGWIIRKIKSTFKSEAPEQQNSTSDKLVQCHKCGIYIAQDRAIEQDNNYYCSVKHLDK